MHATCPAQLILPEYTTQLIFGEQYRLRSCFFRTPFPLRCKTWLETHALALTLCSSPSSKTQLRVPLFSGSYCTLQLSITSMAKASPDIHHSKGSRTVQGKGISLYYKAGGYSVNIRGVKAN